MCRHNESAFRLKVGRRGPNWGEIFEKDYVPLKAMTIYAHSLRKLAAAGGRCQADGMPALFPAQTPT
jgi:hypothetical protein